MDLALPNSDWYYESSKMPNANNGIAFHYFLLGGRGYRLHGPAVCQFYLASGLYCSIVSSTQALQDNYFAKDPNKDVLIVDLDAHQVSSTTLHNGSLAIIIGGGEAYYV